MTSALPPPPRQSLSLADSSSQTCQSDLKSFIIDRFSIQCHCTMLTKHWEQTYHYCLEKHWQQPGLSFLLRKQCEQSRLTEQITWNHLQQFCLGPHSQIWRWKQFFTNCSSILKHILPSIEHIFERENWEWTKKYRSHLLKHSLASFSRSPSIFIFTLRVKE